MARGGRSPVADKLFARIREDGDVLVVWCADEAEKAALIGSAPEKYFNTSHYAGHAGVLGRMNAIDCDELDELLTDAWWCRALKRTVVRFDAGRDGRR